MIRSRTFSRYKYAEEFAADLTKARLPWRMNVEFDVEHLEEDDEVYVYDVYTVEWVVKGGSKFEIRSDYSGGMP